jgi:hypothetical protein
LTQIIDKISDEISFLGGFTIYFEINKNLFALNTIFGGPIYD